MGALGYRVASRGHAAAVRDPRVPRAGPHCGLGRPRVYLALKFGDWLVAGELGTLFGFDHMSRVMWVELGLVIVGVVLLEAPRLRNIDRSLTIGLALLVLAGLANRFSATLFAQTAPEVAAYTPNIAEWLTTIGVIARCLPGVAAGGPLPGSFRAAGHGAQAGEALGGHESVLNHSAACAMSTLPPLITTPTRLPDTG